MLHIPAHFSETRPEALRAVIEAYPFAWLIAPGEGPLPNLSPAPLLYQPVPGGLGKLIGHLAVTNPVAIAIGRGTPVAALFLGPHAYVSVQWYQHARNVPTWNHLEVACTCQGRLLETEIETYAAIDRLVRHYEGDAWRLADQPEGYIRGLMKGIWAFELTILAWEGHFKLSQNKPDTERERIVAQYHASPDTQANALAHWMVRHHPPPTQG